MCCFFLDLNTEITTYEIVDEGKLKELHWSRGESWSRKVDDAFEDFLMKVFGKTDYL